MVMTTNTDAAAIDSVAWKFYADSPPSSLASRITFHTLKAPKPIGAALENCQLAAAQAGAHHLWRPLLVVVGRGRRGAVMDHSTEVRDLLSERERDLGTGIELRKTVGDVATAMIMGGGKVSAASFLVLESGQGKSSSG